MNPIASPASASAEALLAQITDEFLERLNAGQAPDLEAYAQCYPELADVLRQVLPALCLLRQPSSADMIGDGTVFGVLGDFRILRELGRGGMGVVYEADQISLGRRVALKVLPFAATMDARHLQRFHNEARAAAGLHQEHIVPVYAVGCERGVHFYAMQFINGRTLAEWIQQQRTRDGVRILPKTAYHSPSNRVSGETVATMSEATLEPAVAATSGPTHDAAVYRRLAEWGVQAAEALEYAHSVGIVHRDIKPANLMVDSQGKLWVTDFGLARTASDSGLTMTGDLVGTLRYMSPEQALAKHGLVDHRTDVYSLGVTLYELLTLLPAVEGKDRQEILQRIAFEEPAAPRLLNRTVPRDLETVVLKAMAKEPAERYATAKELADDLHRFLDHKSVLARQPSWSQRAVKWSRRHRTLVVASILMLIAIASGSLVATGLIWKEKDRVEQEKESTRQEKERAAKNLTRALDALDQISLRFAEIESPRDPEWNRQNRRLVEQILNFYEAFDRENEGVAEVRGQMARAYRRAGQLQLWLEHFPEAEKAYRKALDLLEPEEPSLPNAQRERLLARAGIYNNLGILFMNTNRLLEAEQALNHSKRLYDETMVDSDSAEALHQQIRVLVNLGGVYSKAGRRKEHVEVCRRADALGTRLAALAPNELSYRLLRANVAQALGSALAKNGASPAEVEPVYRRAIELGEPLLTQLPGGQNPVQAAYRDLALTVKGRGDGEAMHLLEKSIAIGEKLVGEYPNVLQFRIRLGSTWFLLGQVHEEKKRLGPAETAFRQAAECAERLAAADPRNPQYPSLWIDASRHQALALRLQGRTDEAATVYRGILARCSKNPQMLQDIAIELTEMGRTVDALAAFEQVLRLQPDSATALNNVASALLNSEDERLLDPKRAKQLAARAVEREPQNGDIRQTLGLAYYRNGEWKEAAASLHRSLELRKGGDAMDFFLLALAHGKLGEKKQARECYDKAIVSLDKDQAQDEELRRYRAEAAKLLGIPEPVGTKGSPSIRP